MRYTSSDSRIYTRANRQNNISIKGNGLYDVMTECCDLGCDYFCFLDSDDEYEPDFLEKGLALIERENLDIAACGTQFIDAPTGEKINQRYAVKDDMILSGRAFSEKFPNYLQFMFTMWGKLYSLSLLRKLNFESLRGISSQGWDTAFTLEAFSHAKRVGIIGGTLHKYYISPKSSISYFDEKRVKSTGLVFEAYMRYLKKRNALTPRNIDTARNAYLNAIKSTTIVALGSDMALLQKLDALYAIFTNEITRETMERKSPMLPEHLKRELNDTADKWILETIARSPLTRDLPPRSALFLRVPVSAVLDNDIEAAEAEIMRIANEDEIPDEHAEAYLKFAELVCAACENADGWLFFKKLLVRFLLDAGRADEARPKLDELSELLPDDTEISALRDEMK
jgi:glycosyltransferase involved in cell wall biosynthesis